VGGRFWQELFGEEMKSCLEELGCRKVSSGLAFGVCGLDVRWSIGRWFVRITDSNGCPVRSWRIRHVYRRTERRRRRDGRSIVKVPFT